MEITEGRVARAQKAVLYGPEGVGKTTLAAAFPRPLFIDTEGGTGHLDVRRIQPAPSSWTQLMGYVGEVAKAGAALCSTLVLDTADWAERLCAEHVCAANGWKSIEQPGYGKGYVHLRDEFGRLLDRLSDCVEAGVNVVVTAHAQMRKFEQPDEFGAYDRWELKLSKHASPMLKEWADLVLFLNYEVEVVRDSGTGKAKAMGGRRVMFAEHHPCWDAKNRHGLPAKAPLAWESIAACIPDMAEAAPDPVPATAGREPDPMAQPDIDVSKLEFEEVAPAEAEAQAPAADAPDVPPHLRPLFDLMAESGANEADVTGYVEAQGWYPRGTPLANYEEGAVRWLVANWGTVGKDIPTPIA